MRVQGYDRAVKGDTGRFKKSKYIRELFYNGADKCIYVSLVLLLA